MWMYAMRETSVVAILANNLLDAPGCKWLVQPRLEQKLIVWTSTNISLQGQPEIGRKKNIPIFAALPVINANLAAIEIDVADPDVDQLAHPHGCIEHEFKH
jgi:hypothetical protein